MLGKKLKVYLIWLLITLIIYLSIWQTNIEGNALNNDSNINQGNSSLPVCISNIANSIYEYPTQTLSSNDYGSLMNYTSFKFQIVNNCSCSPFLLVVVHSAPENFERRKCIRETWGTKNDNIKVVFMIGNVSDYNVQNLLDAENSVYRDLAQGNFIDDYRNLTYKHVMALKYAIYHCAYTKYILKTDDDVFVNIPSLITYLAAISPHKAKTLLLCNIVVNSTVNRTVGFKWRVSFNEYSNEYFPPYCPGWVIVYSPYILFQLYKAVQKANYFWIDDVLITGIIAQNENIEGTQMLSLILNKYFKDAKIFLFGPPNLPMDKIYLLWEFVNNQTLNKSTI